MDIKQEEVEKRPGLIFLGQSPHRVASILVRDEEGYSTKGGLSRLGVAKGFFRPGQVTVNRGSKDYVLVRKV